MPKGLCMKLNVAPPSIAHPNREQTLGDKASSVIAELAWPSQTTKREP
jgi:hypothetical protein